MSDEENALIPTPTLDNLPISKYMDEGAVATLTSVSTFLPRIQLFVSTSEAVQTGKIPIGHWGLVRSADVVEDLGESINCYPLGMRFKAMLLGENVIAKHNPHDPEFKAILAKSNVPGQQGALAGMEFLLYLCDNDCCVTLFMANISSRREAPNLRALIGKPTTINSKFTKNNKGKWHAPVVVACQTPIEPPDMEKIKDIINTFNNPKDTAIETAKPEETAAAGRAR